MTKTFIIILAAAAAMLGLGFGGAPALAQTRVFVSGQGSDANPCSLSAPCRSFQQAHNTVLAGGEIVALDAAGYGPLNVSKAVTVTAIGIEASITSNSATGGAIAISAGASDVVAIRGLTIIAGTTSNDGIDISAAKSVTIEGCTISGFSAQGILVDPSASLDVELRDVTVTSSGGNGLRILPTGSGKLTMLVSGSSFTGNGESGVSLSGTGTTTINATLSVAAAANSGGGINLNSTSSQPTVVMVTGAKLVNNGAGGLGGGSNVQVFVDRTQISGNGGMGWQAFGGAVVSSYKNNEVNGNGNDGLNGVVQMNSE